MVNSTDFFLTFHLEIYFILFILPGVAAETFSGVPLGLLELLKKTFPKDFSKVPLGEAFEGIIGMNSRKTLEKKNPGRTAKYALTQGIYARNFWKTLHVLLVNFQKHF